MNFCTFLFTFCSALNYILALMEMLNGRGNFLVIFCQDYVFYVVLTILKSKKALIYLALEGYQKVTHIPAERNAHLIIR